MANGTKISPKLSLIMNDGDYIKERIISCLKELHSRRDFWSEEYGHEYLELNLTLQHLDLALYYYSTYREYVGNPSEEG